MRQLKQFLIYIFALYLILKYCQRKITSIFVLFTSKPLVYYFQDIAIATRSRNARTAIVIREIFLKEVYNPPDFKISPSDTVVDIGATFGEYALYAARYTQGKIIACEPFPENLRFLKRTIALNRFNNIIAAPYAIGGYNGWTQLYLSQTNEQHSLLNKDKNICWGETVTVSMVTLPTLWRRYHLKQIGFLKMDCEGAEGEIFQSTPVSYLKRINKISLEFHDAVSILNHRQIMKLLENAGFKVWLKGNDKAVYGYIYAKNRYLS